MKLDAIAARHYGIPRSERELFDGRLDVRFGHGLRGRVGFHALGISIDLARGCDG